MSAAGGSFGERWCVVAAQTLGAVVAELCGWPFERTAAAEAGRRPRAEPGARPCRGGGVERTVAIEDAARNKYRLLLALLANCLLFGVFG